MLFFSNLNDFTYFVPGQKAAALAWCVLWQQEQRVGRWAGWKHQEYLGQGRWAWGCPPDQTCWRQVRAGACWGVLHRAWACPAHPVPPGYLPFCRQACPHGWNDRMCRILCSWLFQEAACKLCIHAARGKASFPICLGIFLFWHHALTQPSSVAGTEVFAQCVLDVPELPGDMEINQQSSIPQGKMCHQRALLLSSITWRCSAASHNSELHLLN